MKALILSALAYSSVTCAAMGYVPVEINWETNNLSDVVALSCDDTPLSGVELEISGAFVKPELNISYEDCGADWKIEKTKFVQKNGLRFTHVLMTGASSCVLKVQEKAGPRSSKVFTLVVAESC